MPALWLLTAGSHTHTTFTARRIYHPAHGGAWGLARSVRNERAETRLLLRCVDLEVLVADALLSML
jgi:hypothetical protein